MITVALPLVLIVGLLTSEIEGGGSTDSAPPSSSSDTVFPDSSLSFCGVMRRLLRLSLVLQHL